jgi:hypothetical protein
MVPVIGTSATGDPAIKADAGGDQP